MRREEWNFQCASKWMQTQLKDTWRFFYDHATEREAACYRAIFQGLIRRQEDIQLPDRDVEICMRAYRMCLADNPLLFYIEKVLYCLSRNAMTMEVTYSMSEEEISDAMWAVRRQLSQLRLLRDTMTDYEKEKYVHDYLVKNVVYDKNANVDIHSAYSSFLQGRAVCDGISKAAKIMFDALGVRSLVCTGSSGHSGIPEHERSVGHAWNMVLIDDVPYHLDITFDNTLTEGGEAIRYDYFNLTDYQIGKDHTLETKIPLSANVQNDYFRRNKLLFTHKETLRAAVADAMKKRKPYLGFRLPFVKDVQGAYDDISKIIGEEWGNLHDHVKTCSISFNREQMVLYLLMEY